MIKEGEKAIDFTLQGIDGKGVEGEFSLKDFRGSSIVLYFYPKDNTSWCTREACDFRDNMSRAAKTGAVVIGVSPDSVKSHKGFQEKHGITFPLLSDPEKKAALSWGAYGEKKMYGKTVKGIIRSTFIIGPDGTVIKVWRGVRVAGHVDEVLEALKG